MIIQITKLIVLVFGIFVLLSGFLMLFRPGRARTILRKFGSNNCINYTEITIRLVVSIAIVLYADLSKSPEILKVLGWFMLGTSLILYAVPRALHHRFSMGCADVLKPIYFQLISPFAFLFGGLIIYSVHW